MVKRKRKKKGIPVEVDLMKHTKEVLPNDHHNNNRVFAVYATQSSVRKCDHMNLYETPPPQKGKHCWRENTTIYK